MDIEFFDFEIFDLDKSGEIIISGPENADIVLVLDEVDFAENKELISNIMKAVNFNIEEDVRQYVIPKGVDINLAELISDKNKCVIVFGLNPKRISMNASFRANSFYKTENFEIMLSFALGDLNNNVGYKKALWKVLQDKFINNE